MLSVVYNNMSKIYLSKNELTKAKEFAFKAIEITRDVNSRYEEKNVLENLSKIYANGNEYENAYETTVRYSELNQQLFSEENIRRIERMKSQYEMSVSVGKVCSSHCLPVRIPMTSTDSYWLDWVLHECIHIH